MSTTLAAELLEVNIDLETTDADDTWSDDYADALAALAEAEDRAEMGLLF